MSTSGERRHALNTPRYESVSSNEKRDLVKEIEKEVSKEGFQKQKLEENCGL